MSLRTYWLSISIRSIGRGRSSPPRFRISTRASPLLRRAEAVDAGDRGDDDHVAAREAAPRWPRAAAARCRRSARSPSRCRGRPAGRTPRAGSSRSTRRSTRPRFREELAELVAELRGQRLVVGDHERRAADLLDDPRHRRGLAGAGRAEQRLVALARLERRGERLDRLRLVAGRPVRVRGLERRPPDQAYLPPCETLGRDSPRRGLARSSGRARPCACACCGEPGTWYERRSPLGSIERAALAHLRFTTARAVRRAGRSDSTVACQGDADRAAPGAGSSRRTHDSDLSPAQGGDARSSPTSMTGRWAAAAGRCSTGSCASKAR